MLITDELREHLSHLIGRRIEVAWDSVQPVAETNGTLILRATGVLSKTGISFISLTGAKGDELYIPLTLIKFFRDITNIDQTQYNSNEPPPSQSAPTPFDS